MSELPSRPHLDHLRRQAKTLLAELRAGDATAIAAFRAHLPAAKRMTADAIRAAGFRLADAQSVVARQTGFASWPGLARHVQELRSLEGEWHFDALEIDANAVAPSMIATAALLIDGDRFRTSSHDATYEGIFTIDTEASPPHIDIDFIDGPEAGTRCEGLYTLAGDRLTLCLALAGARRPRAFVTTAGSGHALEHLHRASAARPVNVTGGTPPPAEPSPSPIDPTTFDAPVTETVRRLAGAWHPVALVIDGKPMPAEWLAMGSRTTTGNETRVVFGGQTMVHARMRFHDGTEPLAVDYLNLTAKLANTVSLGIVQWHGDDEVTFFMAQPGEPRPTDFTPRKKTTLSHWRR